ncbi:hypothetical protein OHB24_03640 [Kribbella sp. NBC_00482]|uniref:hypothetical protein n=1 Tax=Kribbella sp. NBC_00482 TaxID=2975968 RepID=UPI002E1935F8
MTRGTIIATGLATVGLTAGALAVAAPTQAATTAPEAAASPCRVAARAHNDTIRLWYCNGTGGTRQGYHAQALLYSGSNVVLRTASGYQARYNKNNTGGVLPIWMNTGTWWEGAPSPMRACSGTLCTAAAS